MDLQSFMGFVSDPIKDRSSTKRDGVVCEMTLVTVFI